MTEQADKTETVTTTDKAKKEQPKKDTNGYLMILAAFGLFWLAGQFRMPDTVESKFIVARTETSDYFKESVILVLRHNMGGAYGVMLTKSVPDEAGIYEGGPVGQEHRAALYTTDITLPEGKLLGQTGLAYVMDEDIASLEKASPQPMWSRVYKGYAGWDRKQLNREIDQDQWYVLDYDEKLMMETPPEKIWSAAQTKIEAEKPAEEIPPEKRQQSM